MKKFFFLLVLLAGSAQAADSLWLLCDDGGLALNLLEHRDEGGSRLTDLALIYGYHVLLGELKGDEGDVVLKGKSKKKFKGHVKITYADKVVTVNGSLLLSGKISSPVNAQLKCKEMGEGGQ